MEVLELMEILKKEYGITTEQELDKAIEELGGLDITAFQCELKEEEAKEGNKRTNLHNTGTAGAGDR